MEYQKVLSAPYDIRNRPASLKGMIATTTITELVYTIPVLTRRFNRERVVCYHYINRAFYCNA